MTDDLLQPTSRPVQKPDYKLEMLDGELLLYHLEQTQIMYCNQTASLIWQLCSGQQTVDEIITLLAEAFPESADRIRVDVMETLEQFLRAGCIEVT